MFNNIWPKRFNGYGNAAVIMLRFSIPLILSGLLQQLYLWADAFIVGHFIGEDALAAVGVTGSITECITLILVGFTTGLSIIAAQKFGAGDNDVVRRIFSGFLVIMTAAFILIAAAGLAFSGPLLRLINTPGNIFRYSYNYLRIIFIGVPFMSVYNLLAAMLRAVGNSRSSFYAVLISSATNVALDILFVVGLSLGVRGAAAATVISQITMTIYLFSYAVRKYDIFRINKNEKLIHREEILLGCRFAVPLMIQQSVTAVGNFILQGFMNSFGSHTVAAITTAYRVDSIMLLPIFNLGSAISTMAAQSKGIGDEDRKRKFAHTGTVLCIIVSFILMVIMYFFGGDLVGLFGVETEAARIGTRFFESISIYYIAFGIACAFRGVVEGEGRVLYAAIADISALALRIVLSFMMAASVGNMTIAHAEGIQWIFMVICYLPCFILITKRKDRKKTDS